ncbi:MAG: hypothetical protein LKJ69_10690 [Lactobacillus sp.]|jgi:hypothetical protein|nr:hypothetical protein [Lactobacillus sp.]
MSRTNISNSVRIVTNDGDDPNKQTSRRFLNLVNGVTDVQLLGLERIVTSFDGDTRGTLELTRVDAINPG